jgi:hypothetical protein
MAEKRVEMELKKQYAKDSEVLEKRGSLEWKTDYGPSSLKFLESGYTCIR